VYFAKIIFQQSLPKGWVSIWILLFSIIGLLNWLLARPFVSSETNAWGVTSRRFFLYLLPLIGLLWWAILYRLLEYGMTETRAIVVFLAVFLTIVALIFYWKPKTHIAVIPGVLLLITLLYINGGPLSANQLSLQSQLNQWNNIKSEPSNYNLEQAEDVLRYLSDHHPEKVNEYCVKCDSMSLAQVNQYFWASEQIQSCTWTFAQDTSTFVENEFTQLYIEDDGPISTEGFSEIIPINRNNGMEDNVFSNGYSAVLIADVVSDPDHQNEKLQISIRDNSGKRESFFFGQLLENIIAKWEKKQQPSMRTISDKIVFDFDFQGKKFRFVSDYLNYETTTLRVDAISGYLLMRK
jgi:hypothetical protein